MFASRSTPSCQSYRRRCRARRWHSPFRSQLIRLSWLKKAAKILPALPRVPWWKSLGRYAAMITRKCKTDGVLMPSTRDFGGTLKSEDDFHFPGRRSNFIVLLLKLHRLLHLARGVSRRASGPALLSRIHERHTTRPQAPISYSGLLGPYDDQAMPCRLYGRRDKILRVLT